MSNLTRDNFYQSYFHPLDKQQALALLPTENQIFMACLDAHLYEIEYTVYKITSF
jgi:hypothetical protein